MNSIILSLQEITEYAREAHQNGYLSDEKYSKILSLC